MAPKLAALEVQLCSFVHPDWLPAVGVMADQTAAYAGRSSSFSAALSRHLIDQYNLEPLTEDMFAHDWTYAVLGGHDAMRALANQLTTYLLATWVQGAISGVHVRALCQQLGPDVYTESLRHQQPLQSWPVPKSVPQDLVSRLNDQSQTLLDVLWLCHAPPLAPWAALMSAPRHGVPIGRVGGAISSGYNQPVPSQAVLQEINQRLQEDFEIDVASIFHA